MVSLSLMGSRSRKAAFIAAFLIAVLAVSVYAYLASLPSPPGPRVTITSPPLQFSMQLDKTEYRLGENMTIKFWLKNTSNKTITLQYPDEFPYPLRPSHPMLFDFVITDINGTEIYRWSHEHMSLAVLYEFTLNPGQEINDTNFWYLETGYPYVQVSAGTYYVRGVIPPGRAGLWFWVNGAEQISLETPSVAILTS